MVQHEGPILALRFPIPHHSIKMRLIPQVLISVFVILLSNNVARAAAQTNPNGNSALPADCLTPFSSSTSQQSCEQELYKDIQYTINDYTQKFAAQFSFCVSNAVQERNAAFDFSENLTFLSTCLFDTQGAILDYICSGVEIKAYLSSLVNLIQSSNSGTASDPISNVNCNESYWSQGCEDGWSKAQQTSIANVDDLYQNTSVIPLRSDKSIMQCCEGFFCPRGLSCMLPCPLGAHCPKSSYTAGLCSPYNYRLTPAQNYSCGGANLWADQSNSNGTFCPAGSFCPATTDIRQCGNG